METLIDDGLLEQLLDQARMSPRLRMNLDLRTSPSDGSQRMLNALLPGTLMPIHRHMKTIETLVLLRGRMVEIYYDEVPDNSIDDCSRRADVCSVRGVIEAKRVLLDVDGPVRGLCVPMGRWHSIEVLEPTVILECKDGAYAPLGPEDIIEQ